MNERFARIERLIGAAALRRIQQSFVTVVGLGAVGSYAVEGLARGGVGRLRLVDFDVIRRSNINRQLYALESTVGESKTDVARQRVLDINPACQVETLTCFAHVETAEAILAGPPDLLIDAIDSVGPKAELLAAAAQRGVPVLSVMGAAKRMDPTQVRVGPLSEAHHCPLAFQVRKRLRRRGAPVDFPCIYSTEPVPAEPGGDPAGDGEGQHSRGRARRVLGSLPTLTGIFGLTAANYALCRLAGLERT